MSVQNFKEYSIYYDLINTGKDYAAEAAYVTGIIAHFKPAAKKILELGCGTGNHAEIICSRGFKVTGIEKSEQMAEIARSKSIPDFDVITGDMTAITLDDKFDCAISLFHVISYLVDDEDIFSTLKGVSESLVPGGLFIFDAWFTPAVYFQGTERRVRSFENDFLKITRESIPLSDDVNNTVGIDFIMNVISKTGESSKNIREHHLLRHFSIPEIKLFAMIAGFKLRRAEEFLSGDIPGRRTWGVCYILQKEDEGHTS